MSNEKCIEIRAHIMYFIDNEVDNLNKNLIAKHLKGCDDCQSYLNSEQDIKKKICQKLKDVYVCQCDINKLQDKIIHKIQQITKSKS